MKTTGQSRFWRAVRVTLKWTGITFVGLLLCLTTFEIYLRIAIPYKPNLRAYEVDFDLGRRLIPNFKGQDYGVEVRFNSHGMRDREFEPKRPLGTDRILVLGDSWTFGLGVPVEETWPKQLEALLAGGQVPIEVMNAGVSGYETCHEALYYERDLRAFEHDLVLVGMFPVNDVQDRLRKYARLKSLHDNHPLLYDIYTFPKRHLYVVQWYKRIRKERRLRRHARLYESSGSDDHGFTRGEFDWTGLYNESSPGWRLMLDSLNSIGRTARECGAHAAVILFPDVANLQRYESYCHPKVQPMIQKAVQDAGLVFIDSWPYFKAYKGRETEIALGGRHGATHLGPKGYEILAHAVSEELVRAGLIDKETGRVSKPR